jgi:hypothetical protein
LLGIAESFFAWLASTGMSAFAGILLALALGRYLKPRYFLAFSLGILLWVFVDVINDAGNLDVNASFAGGWEQVIIVGLFACGVVAFLFLDRLAFSPALAPKSSIAIPLFIAIAVGLHGLGEGAAFADISATTPINSLISAFGGEAAGAAYVLHKFLESVVVGAGYLVFSGGRTAGVQSRARDAVVLTLAFILPSVLAMGTGYYIAFDASYFYALGTGALLYALLKLAGPLFTTQEGVGPNGSLKTAVWLLAGLLCVYLAALLHSYVPGLLA